MPGYCLLTTLCISTKLTLPAIVSSIVTASKMCIACLILPQEDMHALA